MEIGSMGGMTQGMSMEGMRPMRPPSGDPAEHAEKMSAKIMEKQDADGDGQLSANEFDSDLLAALDENEDGILSQEELQSGLQSKMEEGKAAFESGGVPSSENRAFMQQMFDLAGPPEGGMNSQAKATQAYSLMQEAMFGTDTQYGSSYDTNQMALDNLSLVV